MDDMFRNEVELRELGVRQALVRGCFRLIAVAQDSQMTGTNRPVTD